LSDDREKLIRRASALGLPPGAFLPKRDSFNEGLAVSAKELEDATPSNYEARETRLRCLAEANATAKLGLSHDVYQTADKYYRWVTGEKIEAVPELPFKTAVIALMEAEILGERTDIEKLREELAEAFGIVEDKHWPRQPMSPEDQAIVDEASARFAKAGGVMAADDVRRAQDAEFIGGFEWPAGRRGPPLKAPLEIDPEGFLGGRPDPADGDKPYTPEEVDRRMHEPEDRILQSVMDSLRGSAV
jgi:hypothetical protein